MAPSMPAGGTQVTPNAEKSHDESAVGEIAYQMECATL